MSTFHTKNQKRLSLDEKGQLADAKSEMTQMFVLLDNTFLSSHKIF